MNATSKQITEFKRLAKLKEFKKEGYVYVGKGLSPKMLIDILGMSVTKCVNGKMYGQFNGMITDQDYYIKESDWNKLFGVPVKKVAPKPKAESIDSRVALAKTFIGKKLTLFSDKNVWAEAKTVEVLFDNKKIVNAVPELKARFKKHLDLHGNVVVLMGEYSDGSDMVRCVDSNADMSLYVEKVRINGFDAEEFKTYYKFGCAKISKRMLRDVRDFLFNWEAPSKISNRKLESVKIGAGDFTFETLNKLNLD